MFNKNYHKHSPIAIFPDMQQSPVMSIDSAVQKLWRIVTSISLKTEALRNDMTAIHAHYRKQYCKDCCHRGICGHAHEMKYGDECENKEESI